MLRPVHNNRRGLEVVALCYAIFPSVQLLIQGAERVPELNLGYSVAWRGFGLGEIRITLKPDGAADCYRYESSTDPVGIVRMFFGTPHEVSQFCISGGRLVSKHFEYVKSKNDSENFTLDFDGGKVRDPTFAQQMDTRANFRWTLVASHGIEPATQRLT